MNGRIIFHQTNIKFDQNFIQKLNENSGEWVFIFISGGSHPEGCYAVPRDVISDFIDSKKDLPCWSKYGYWTQSKVPKPLFEYFYKQKDLKPTFWEVIELLKQRPSGIM